MFTKLAMSFLLICSVVRMSEISDKSDWILLHYSNCFRDPFSLSGYTLAWWCYQEVKEFRWHVSPFWHNIGMWQTDRQTVGWIDRIVMMLCKRKRD